MLNKIHLHKGIVAGNLKDYEQEYQLNYLPEEGDLSAKLELAILFKKEGMKEFAFRSTRFSNPDSYKIFILENLKALAFFKNSKGELNENNTNLYISNLLNEVDRYFRNGLKIERLGKETIK